jgi:hypothetical protein
MPPLESLSPAERAVIAAGDALSLIASLAAAGSILVTLAAFLVRT